VNSKTRLQSWGIGRFILIGVFTLFIFFSIYWLIVSSTKPLSQMLTTNPSLFPNQVTLKYYTSVLSHSRTLSYIANSFIIASITTFIAIFLSSLAGYSLSRLQFWGRKVLAQLLLFTYILPPVLLVIPLYIMFVKYGLVDTRTPLIIAYTTFSLPFCTWMLRGFFITIPRELEEAALIDGTSRLGALIRIILPLSAPGIVAAAMFSFFLLCWNEYLYALVFINDPELRTLPLGIAFYSDHASGIMYGELMAMATIAATPVFLVFILLQKYLIRGLSMGAVKG